MLSWIFNSTLILIIGPTFKLCAKYVICKLITYSKSYLTVFLLTDICLNTGALFNNQKFLNLNNILSCVFT